MPIEPREALPRKEIVKRIQNYVHPFRVTSGKGFDLKEFDPGDTRGLKMEKGEAADLLQRGSEWLAMEQDMLYAQDRWSLLLVFQAMDAAGKDGTIKHVMSGSIRRAVRSFRSSSRQRKNSLMTFCGATPRESPNEGKSESSTGRTMRRFSLFACTRNS